MRRSQDEGEKEAAGKGWREEAGGAAAPAFVAVPTAVDACHDPTTITEQRTAWPQPGEHPRP